MIPDNDRGVAHHGAPILTQRDYELCCAMVKWIDTVKGSGKGFVGAENFVPTHVDIIKSRLFWRIRSGKEPLPHPPPTAYSCPWYEVVEDFGRHYLWEQIWESDLVTEGGPLKAVIAQCSYTIIERGEDNKPRIVGFGPWKFECGACELPPDYFTPPNPGARGWYIQRLLP